VQRALDLIAQAERVALTREHPAVKDAIGWLNQLTDAERDIIHKVHPVLRLGERWGIPEDIVL